jgi:hypothetical protein
MAALWESCLKLVEGMQGNKSENTKQKNNIRIPETMTESILYTECTKYYAFSITD